MLKTRYTSQVNSLKMALSGSYFGVKSSTLYQVLKYSIYLLIMYNVGHFTYEDYMASAHRFRDGITLSNVTDAFAQAIDSIAWLVLLLMLELETWVIEDEKLVGLKRWAINGLAALCYFFIVQAFIGYYSKLLYVLAFNSSDLANACQAVGTQLSYMINIDSYAALSANSCINVGAGPYFINEADNIIASTAKYSDAVLLGYTEVINAGTWITVVMVLWVDVFLQLRGGLTSRLYRLNVWIKAVLYSILVIAAIIWGIYGEFMDFWDAFIWIIAFVFIELNLFQWHGETEANLGQKAALDAPGDMT